MKIVRIMAADVTRFLTFRAEGLSNNPDNFRITLFDDGALGTTFWQKRLENDYVVAIEKEGKWLGMGGLFYFKQSKIAHKGLIWGMYMTPQARGKGVADEIIIALIAQSSVKLRQTQLAVNG